MEVVGSIVGGMIASDGAQEAADTQAAAADRATALQKDIFDRQVTLQEPWRLAGQNALARILEGFNNNELLRSFGANDFTKDPGFDFRKLEGLKALDRASAAGGRFGSGRAMKDILRFSQGLASDEYGRSFDRFTSQRTNQFNRLASVAGLGQTAANQTSSAAGQYGSAAADNQLSGAAARAAGQVGSANAWTRALGQGMSMYQNRNSAPNALYQAGYTATPSDIDQSYLYGPL